MKDELQEYRERIDAIDTQLVHLFEERMQVVEKIGEYKKEHGLPVLNQGRQDIVLEKARNNLADPRYEGVVTEWMEKTMALARSLEGEKD